MLAGIIMLLILYESSFDNDAVDMKVNSKSNRHEETQDTDSRYFTVTTGEFHSQVKDEVFYNSKKKENLNLHSSVSCHLTAERSKHSGSRFSCIADADCRFRWLK